MPFTVEILDAVALLLNGKVDRLALPAPCSAQPQLESPFGPPRAPSEEALAEREARHAWASQLVNPLATRLRSSKKNQQ